ncbi:MAG: zinc-binding alcohol dehydrogenase family protein [Betaproteobacteria bacterium]|nr:zinc-binding alcohol dehydrogenase family protein [Betaproteobacteria bacterium]
MKAILANEPLPVSDPRSLVDAEVPDPPAPQGHDILVRVEAISVNPVDTKTRMLNQPGAAGTKPGPRILGWDAAGVVRAVGEQVTLFKPGDAVYYAGSNQRPGSNAQLQLVDERIVAKKPAKLEFAQAAAMPLTTITAYESIVTHMGVDPDGGSKGARLLVIAGAGGVGSMAIQIGRKLGLVVIATASRPESTRWCRDLGARHVINHRQPLKDGLTAIGAPAVDYVLVCSDIDLYWTQFIDIVRPLGTVCSIVRNENPADILAIQRKSLRFAWEGMFSRSTYQTADMIEQHRLLARVGDWIDAGEVKCTLTEKLSPVNAANLRAAHARLESKGMIGKLVLSGW